MKIPYSNLPFKTNRNVLTKFGAGVTAPNNLNNRLARVQIKTLTLPKFVYHMSTTPISEFKANRIFYVSFSKDQAFLHVKQYLDKLQYKINNKNETKIYVYTLKPRTQTMRAIIFDKDHRPKNISNGIGLKYNTFSRSGVMKMSEGNNLNRNNVNSKNFSEGSGDNMILGHLLCSKTKTNGIRNVINQDELAICNPKNFFTVYDKQVLDVGLRKNGPMPLERAIRLKSIKFTNMKYTPSSLLSLLNRYGTSKIQKAKAKLALKSIIK